MRTALLSSSLRYLDLYGLLEVSRDASPDAIRRAYRRGALASHPDRHPDDQQAAQRFLLLTQARDILLDPDLRLEYDRIRSRSDEGNQAGAAAGSAALHRTARRGPSDQLSEQRLAGKAQRSHSAAELTALWKVNSTVVKAAVLRNVACPVSLFSEPCVVEHWMLGLEAANRAGCPEVVLDKLAFSFERSVALAVASHPAASPAALHTITARHRDLPIMLAVARHRNTGAETLREIGRRVSGPRFAALASVVLAHPACPADAAERIRARLGDRVA